MAILVYYKKAYQELKNNLFWRVKMLLTACTFIVLAKAVLVPNPLHWFCMENVLIITSYLMMFKAKRKAKHHS